MCACVCVWCDLLQNKAKALGIKPGPIFGKLKTGEAVTLEDGRVITQSDVCDRSLPGAEFLIVDCPTEQ